MTNDDQLSPSAMSHHRRAALLNELGEVARVAQEAKQARDSAASLSPKDRLALDRAYLHAMRMRSAVLREITELDATSGKSALLQRLYAPRPPLQPAAALGATASTPGSSSAPSPPAASSEVALTHSVNAPQDHNNHSAHAPQDEGQSPCSS